MYCCQIIITMQVALLLHYILIALHTKTQLLKDSSLIAIIFEDPTTNAL